MNILVSYKMLRRTIGVLALAFPFLLMLGTAFAGRLFPPSLSQSYWSNAGVLFSGMLITFGIFLLTYYGYDFRDRVVTALSGLLMIVVALFPCEGGAAYLFQFLSPKATAVIHYVSAGLAFSGMGAMSFFLFTLGDSGTKGKKRRNRVYRACGATIFVMVLLMLILQIGGLRERTDAVRLFWWAESIVVWAFGFSWLVKGETLLKD